MEQSDLRSLTFLSLWNCDLDDSALLVVVKACPSLTSVRFGGMPQTILFVPNLGVHCSNMVSHRLRMTNLGREYSDLTKLLPNLESIGVVPDGIGDSVDKLRDENPKLEVTEWFGDDR